MCLPTHSPSLIPPKHFLDTSSFNITHYPFLIPLDILCWPHSACFFDITLPHSLPLTLGPTCTHSLPFTPRLPFLLTLKCISSTHPPSFPTPVWCSEPLAHVTLSPALHVPHSMQPHHGCTATVSPTARSPVNVMHLCYLCIVCLCYSWPLRYGFKSSIQDSNP